MLTPVPSGSNWAKLSPRGGDPKYWHPLVDHCIDVAACTECLLALPIVRARLTALAGVVDFPEIWAERLSALALLHDFGKANRGFQSRACNPSARAGHIAEAAYVVDRDRLRHATGLNALDAWSLNGVLDLFLLVTLAYHHGAPPDLDMLPQCDQVWSADQDHDPLRDVSQLVEEARCIWPPAFVLRGVPLPEAISPFWHCFLGLLQLADWLGSDDAVDAFPFSEYGDGPRIAFARDRANALIRHIGFDPMPLRAELPAKFDFSRISPFAPSDIQLATAEAPGPVVVLEAETGSGKTEAALWRFARLFAEGKVDGLYFALPTRVAASQIHGRVQEAANRLFGSAAPEVLRAVPGDVRMDSASVRSLPGFTTQWDDDPDEGVKRSRWAAGDPSDSWRLRLRSERWIKPCSARYA